MPSRHLCESLEPRHLLSGGFTTTGSPTTLLVTIPSVRAASTATAVGSAGNVLIAYVKNSNLFAQIVDASAHVIVPEFEIDNGGLSPNGQVPMASTTDSSGNAVIVYPIGEQFSNLYIVRINSAGLIVDAPTFIGGTGSQSAPGLAAGPNGQIAIAYAKKFSGVSGVFSRVLDSSDSPVFDPEVQLSDAAPQGVSQELFTNISAIYNPDTSRYLAVWNVQDVDQNSNNLRHAIDDRSFTSAGVLGADPEADSSTTDDFSKAVLILDAINHQTLLAFYQTQRNSVNQFIESFGHLDALDADGHATAHTNTLPTSPSPAEILAFAAFTDQGFFNILLDSGFAGLSDFSPSEINALTINPQGTVVATNDNIAPANFVYDPFIVPTGTDTFLVVSPAFNTSPQGTTISATVGTFTVPTNSTGGGTTTGGDTGGTTTMGINVTLSASTITRSADGAKSPDMVVTASITDPAPSDIFVHIDNLDPTSIFNKSLGGPAGNVSTTITIKMGATTGTVDLPIAAYRAGDSLSENVDLHADVAPFNTSTFNIVDPTFFGVVNTTPGTATSFGKGTVAASKPLTFTDPDGDRFKAAISGPGALKFIGLPDGNIKIAASGTTSGTIITFTPIAGGTGDSFCNIEQFTATSPLNAVNGANVNCNGLLNLKSVNSAILGDLSGRSTIGSSANASVKFGNVLNDTFNLTGIFKSIALKSASNSIFTAATINTFTVTGDFNANLSANTLGDVKVGGTFLGADAADLAALSTRLAIHSITASIYRNVSIFVGLKPAAASSILPPSRRSFLNPTASIGSIKATQSFSNTLIAAPIIGTVNLTGVVTTNPSPFGIAAESVKSYKRDSVTKKNVTKKGVFDSQDQFVAKAE